MLIRIMWMKSGKRQTEVKVFLDSCSLANLQLKKEEQTKVRIT